MSRGRRSTASRPWYRQRRRRALKDELAWLDLPFHPLLHPRQDLGGQADRQDPLARGCNLQHVLRKGGQHHRLPREEQDGARASRPRPPWPGSGRLPNNPIPHRQLNATPVVVDQLRASTARLIPVRCHLSRQARKLRKLTSSPCGNRLKLKAFFEQIPLKVKPQ